MSGNNSAHADVVTVAPKPSGFNPKSDIYPDEDSQQPKKLEQQRKECYNSCCDGTCEACEACCEIFEDLIQFCCCVRFWSGESSNCCSCCEGSDGCCEGSDGCCEGSDGCCEGSDGCCDGCCEGGCDGCDGCVE